MCMYYTLYEQTMYNIMLPSINCVCVSQVLPAHPHNGWSLYSVCHGLRVFSRFFPSLGVVSDTPCLAATTVINISPKVYTYIHSTFIYIYILYTPFTLIYVHVYIHPCKGTSINRTFSSVSNVTLFCVYT